MRRARSVRSGLMASIVSLVALSCGQTTSDSGGQASPSEITVAAASDLRPAFEALAEVFERENGTRVTLTFGSSGQLREQVLNGAPFDLFASANVAYVDEVIEAGIGLGETKADYALGRIVLWSPDEASLPESIDDLASPQYERIAIANPQHAPYGLAAEQALQAAGIADAVSARLVFGENISDTFQICDSGNADVCIVALSLAVADGSAYTIVPDSFHQPLRQALVVTTNGSQPEAATAFAALVNSPDGRAVMNQYGFTLPGESP